MTKFFSFLSLIILSISSYAAGVSGFSRIENSYTRDVDSRSVSINIAIDIPQPGMAGNSQLQEWLNKLALTSFNATSFTSANPDDNADILTAISHNFFHYISTHTSILKDTHRSVACEYFIEARYSTQNYVTYIITSRWCIDAEKTTVALQPATFDLLTNTPLTNNDIFLHNKFKDVHKQLLKALYADTSFMQSDIATHASIKGWKDVATIFGAGDYYSWDNFPLPQGALTPQGILFCLNPSGANPYISTPITFSLPYATIYKYITPNTSTIISPQI